MGREAFPERMIAEADGPTVTLRTCFGTPYEVEVASLRRWLDDHYAIDDARGGDDQQA